MRRVGVDDVVTKPLDPMKLGEVIQRLTGQRTVTNPSPSRPPGSSPLTAIELSELALRLWKQIASRDSDLSELFGLSDEPSSPEDLQRVLDIADVIERSGDSVRRTLLIFQGFLDCFREQLLKLGEAKQATNVEDMRFASHALKGLLLDVGARVSGGLASSIEQHCKHGHTEQAVSLISSLTKQTLLVSRLITQITRVAGGEQSPDAAELFLKAPNSGDTIEHD